MSERKHSHPADGLTAPPRPARAAVYAGLAVLGALVAVAGSLVQGGWFPGGLVLALLATAGVFLGGLRLTGTQMGVGAPAAGWLIAAVLLSIGRPEGDAAFSAGVGPLIYLLGGMVVAVMCATMSRLPQPGTKSGRLER